MVYMKMNICIALTIFVMVSVGMVKRSLWGIILAFFMGASIFSLAKILQDFSVHPVRVSIEIHQGVTHAFPAVTFCSMSPFKKSKLIQNTTHLTPHMDDQKRNITKRRADFKIEANQTFHHRRKRGM